MGVAVDTRGLGDAAVVAEELALDFAGLLRRLRGEAKLTQEELAAAYWPGSQTPASSSAQSWKYPRRFSACCDWTGSSSSLNRSMLVSMPAKIW